MSDPFDPFAAAIASAELSMGKDSVTSFPPRHASSPNHQNSTHDFDPFDPFAQPSPPPITSSSNEPPTQSLASSSTSRAHIPSLSNYTKTTVPRRPRPGNEVAASDLRPSVSAGDRLYCWTTPYAAERNASLFEGLPPELADHTYSALRGALAPNSKTNYGAGLLRFTQFCDKWAIPETDRMPASYALLCSFIGAHKGTQSGGTIKSWLSGLKAWHDLSDAQWFGDHRWVQMARVTANKEGTQHKRPLRAPVSIEHLLALRKAIDITLPFHAAVWAVATGAFFGCRRLGEMTVTTLSAFDKKYHVLRSTPISYPELRDGSRSANFRIPWTKTTRDDGATVILTAREDELCPRWALRNHIAINGNVPPDASLFAYQTQDDTHWRHMQKHVFLDFCTDIWSRASLAHILGHSFRIGGAVELLLAGVPPEIVAATGGWTSLAFLLYWRRMEEILPMSTSRAYKKSHFDELATIFEEFRIAHRIPRNLISISDGPFEI